MNNKLDIFTVKEIEKVINFLTTEKDINNITESSGVSTVEVSSTLLLGDIDNTYLQIGHYVQIANKNYKVVDVVQDVSFDIEVTGIETETKWALALEFRPGSLTEINDLLVLANDKPEEQLSRFPLLWLMIDADNQRDFNTDNLLDYTTNVKFSMINLTDRDYTAEDRLDNNFIPTIQPYVTLFLRTLYSQYFSTVFFIETDIIDYRDFYRYFYGSADLSKNVITDVPTDAIEFDINISFYKQYCD